MALAQVVNSKYQQLFLIAFLCNTFRSFSRQQFLCNSDNVPSNHTRQFLCLSTVPLDSPSTPCTTSPAGDQPVHRRTASRYNCLHLPISTRGSDWCVHRPTQSYQSSRLHSSNWTVQAPCATGPGGEQPIHRRTIYRKTACSFPISTNSVYWSRGDKGMRLVCAQTPAQAYQTSRLHSSKLDSLSTECNGSWGNNRIIYGFAQGRTALPETHRTPDSYNETS